MSVDGEDGITVSVRQPWSPGTARSMTQLFMLWSFHMINSMDLGPLVRLFVWLGQVASESLNLCGLRLGACQS